MELALFWLPVIGGILLGGIAWNAWYGGNKILALWLGFFGIICFMLVAVLQIQKAIQTDGSGTDIPASKRSIVFVEYSNLPAEVTDLPFGKGIAIKFMLKNLGDAPATITKIKTHLYIAETEPDPFGPTGAASQEDMRLPDEDGLMSLGVYGPFVLAPNETSKLLQLNVGFKQAKIDAVNIFNFKNRFRTHLWFLCVVTYDDVYGKGRETSYFVRQSGTGISAADHKKYNYQR